jgi:hypothetical protein
VNVDTGEFLALRESAAVVDEYRSSNVLLIDTILSLASGKQQPQASRPERPRLRLIKGGKR